MTNNAAIAALPNLRVLELASLIPGPYCGKLLGLAWRHRHQG